ncbi:MAG: ribbon-helix-helix protein, CopG family [Candidatus Firestonebacteria bacterium]|nr:ribbon-helix-helix protein, CopG family [Candidatus Firestonebacteria bacterium]
MRKNAIASFSLPQDVMRQADELVREEKKTKSEIVREAIKQYYSSYKWRKLQEVGIKKAKKIGIKSEEDIYTWLNRD